MVDATPVPEPAPGRRRLHLRTRILLGLLLGAGSGVLCNLLFPGSPRLGWWLDNVLQPIGQVFLRMLFMVVVPLVFTSVTLGVASLGDPRRIGRIGLKTLAFFLLTTALATCIGLTLVNLIRPGTALDPGVRAKLLSEFTAQASERIQAAEQSKFGINTFVNIIPRNPMQAAANGDMLALLFFSLVCGLSLTLVPPARARPVLDVLEGVAAAVMVIIGFAMSLAPIGVFALVFTVAAKFGYELLAALLRFVLTVLSALLIHQLVVIPTLARGLAGIAPRRFLSGIRELAVTAFSTSSSSATLPTTIKTATLGFGVPREIAGFVLPLGATMNMNGTALFEGVTVLFLAQVFGVPLALPQQIVVVVMSVITAVGVAGVPSGSIPLLVMVLGIVGVPGEGIALILGVDRLLDMCRTVPNVTGDLLTALWVTRSEGLPLTLPSTDAEP